MTEQRSIEFQTIQIIERAFESLGQDLDTLANKYELKSDTMMAIINRNADFITYYGEWIRESWDFDNGEVVEA